jgi:sporulation protein YlmC with PRC-barrel domain
MLQLSGTLIDQPVLSLRTGAEIAIAYRPLINPNNLKIEGFYCRDLFNKHTLILLNQDVREIIRQGFVVDDHEVLVDPEELVRLKEVIDIGFDLLGKPVVTPNKQNLGKVSDFAADGETLYVQKLYVERSLLKSFGTGQLGIDRNQIIEITNRHIVVQDPLQPTKVRVPARASMPTA